MYCIRHTPLTPALSGAHPWQLPSRPAPPPLGRTVGKLTWVLKVIRGGGRGSSALMAATARGNHHMCQRNVVLLFHHEGAKVVQGHISTSPPSPIHSLNQNYFPLHSGPGQRKLAATPQLSRCGMWESRQQRQRGSPFGLRWRRTCRTGGPTWSSNPG
jgi:hypothetical protein